MPKKISEVRKEEFKILYKKGFNDYEIAEKMRLSDSTIFRWRKSFGFKPYNTRIKNRNKSIEPTQEQKEILCGTLLGDSSLQLYPKYGWKSPIFKCDHGLKQEDYAQLLYNKLHSLGSKIRKYKRYHPVAKKEYVTITVTTASNPYYLKMYNQLYSTGKKQVTEDFLQNFTIKSLAYLYMDDGYADQNTAYICTDSFSDKSKQILVNYFEKEFSLHFTIVNHGKYYRLRLSQYDFPKFVLLLEPYVIDSLKYKLETVS